MRSASAELTGVIRPSSAVLNAARLTSLERRAQLGQISSTPSARSGVTVAPNATGDDGQPAGRRNKALATKDATTEGSHPSGGRGPPRGPSGDTRRARGDTRGRAPCAVAAVSRQLHALLADVAKLAGLHYSPRTGWTRGEARTSRRLVSTARCQHHSDGQASASATADVIVATQRSQVLPLITGRCQIDR